MTWNYGLIREKGKLKLCEIYWNKKYQPWTYTYVTFWQFLQSPIMIIKDIKSQFKHYHIIHEDDINGKSDWLNSLKKWEKENKEIEKDEARRSI